MENIFYLLASQLRGRPTQPTFKRYRIGATGVSSLLLAGRPSLQVCTTKDGERIHFYEDECSGATYGLILIEMQERLCRKQTESVLVNYLCRIRRPFGIAFNASMEMEESNGATHLTDYWQDEDGQDWKVCGCSDGKTMAVLYVKNIAASTVAEHDAFLESFRFPPLS